MLGQELLGQHNVQDMLAARVELAGGVSGFARDVGIWPDEVYKMLHGKRPPSKKVLDLLGLERIFVYKKKSTKK